jgi:hypothetical protein
MLIVGLLILLLAWHSHAAPASRIPEPPDPVRFLRTFFGAYGNLAAKASPVTFSMAQGPGARACPLAAA